MPDIVEWLQSDLLASIEVMQDGLAVTNSAGNFIYMNDAHLKMFGYQTSDEILGQPWSVLYPEQTARWFNDFVMPSLFEFGTWRGEATGVTREGKPVVQEVSLSLSPTGNLICLTRNILRRKVLETEDLSLRSFIDSFLIRNAIHSQLDVAAHDISSLLTLAEARVRLAGLETDMSGTRGQLRLVEQALGEARRTVREMLKNERTEVGQQSYDLVEFVRSVGNMANLASLRGSAVLFVSEVESVSCSCDANVLMRALLNLLRNADEAGGSSAIELKIALKPSVPTGGAWRQAKVGKAASESVIHISVSDRGCGIPEDSLGKLFNAFYSTKQGAGHSSRGLGLNSVVQLVGRYGADVTVSSAVGEGSVFELSVPVEDIVATRMRRVFTSKARLKTVAVADDDEDWRRTICQSLAENGFRTQEFKSIKDLDSWLTDPGHEVPDAMVLDYYFLDEGGSSRAAMRVADKWPETVLVSFSASDVAPSALFGAVVPKSAGVPGLMAALETIQGMTKTAAE